MGATSTLQGENSAWRLLFGEKCAPPLYPKVLFFNCFDQNVGKKCKSRRCLVEKTIESKNF